MTWRGTLHRDAPITGGLRNAEGWTLRLSGTPDGPARIQLTAWLGSLGDGVPPWEPDAPLTEFFAAMPSAMLIGTLRLAGEAWAGELAGGGFRLDLQAEPAPGGTLALAASLRERVA